MNNARTEIVKLFDGQKTLVPPAFSGLIHVTAEGLESEGLVFHEVHHDAKKMAKAAASTFRLTGMPSAALPLDLCAPAEALGAVLNYYDGQEYQFPQPAKPLFASTKYLNAAYLRSTDFVSKGRIPLICDAIRLLKEGVDKEVVISGIIPGPYTLLLYLIEPGGLFSEMKREPQAVLDALSQLSTFLAQIGNAYRQAGADFITIHDMGGSPGFIGPAKYEQFVFPAEKHLIAALPKPRILSMCGIINPVVHLLGEIGADAVSIDQTTDLITARATLLDTLLLGNIDPVETLWRGNRAEVREAAHRARAAGVDAVWPGCDLVLQTSIENLEAFVATSQ
ncbi:MAG TPA: uroporphyrinogen decarboxylase family protein [Anaerolineales bacterium]